MPDQIAVCLRQGLPLENAQFDALYPSWAQAPSRIHWTPVEVARRAAELLVVHPGLRVLDVGAGAGKFCIVGALTTSGDFHGIEQRPHLVTLAQETARRLRVLTAHFQLGNMRDVDWRAFQGFYLYNPFFENHVGVIDPVDDTVELDLALFSHYIHFVRAQLALAELGTRVVTFHGFGGELPAGYEREVYEKCGNGQLELWVKTAQAAHA